MFCEESLGKIKFRVFSKRARVGTRILSLESVDYFVTGEHYLVVEKNAMVGCCKLTLYANGSCDEHAVHYRDN